VRVVEGVLPTGHSGQKEAPGVGVYVLVGQSEHRELTVSSFEEEERNFPDGQSEQVEEPDDEVNFPEPHS